MFWEAATHCNPASQPPLFHRALQNLLGAAGQYAWSRRDSSCHSCLDTRHLRRDRVCGQGWRDGCSSRSLYPTQSTIEKGNKNVFVCEGVILCIVIVDVH